MSGLPKSTDDTYKDLMKKDKVVIFKMSATWCNPCKVATEVCLSYLEKNPSVKIFHNHLPSLGLSMQKMYLKSQYLLAINNLVSW